MRVAWQPPQVYRGVLRGYIIRAYHGGNSSIDPVEMRFNEIRILNATLSGLEPYTWYDVRVAAFTNGGTGESPGTRVRTLESGKSRVRLVLVTARQMVGNLKNIEILEEENYTTYLSSNTRLFH
jgi:hypothetical protein